MEIFNNLITAFTVRNEVLIYILSVPLTFIETYVFMLLFQHIFKITSNFKNNVIFVISAGILNLFNLYIVPEPFNLFVNYIFTFFIIYFTFKTNLLRSFGCTIMPVFIFNLIALLITNPYINVADISCDELLFVPIYRLIYMFIIYTIVTIIIIFIKYTNYNISLSENLNKKTKTMIYLCILFGFIAVISEILVLFYNVEVVHISITFLSSISLLAYFLISIYTLTSVTKLANTTKKLESAELYNLTLSKLHDQVRGFKHDFDNTITTIGGYIITEDMEGLKNYYKDLVKDAHNTNTLYLLDPSLINNDGVYNLLVTKYHEAEAKDINLTITFLLDLKKLRMSIYEFARVLGILLDNAIEASSESAEKILNIIFRHDFKNDVQIITIENSYNDKNVDLTKIFTKGTSTKPNHNGLGLWEVKKILSKYDKCNLLTNTNNNLFIQQIELLCPSKSLVKV